MKDLCSIVIPVHNRAGLTRLCLDRLFAEPPAASHEIIVVDDASTDDTQQLLAKYGDAIQVVEHEENAGFATACNDGAKAAEGRYLVFLNNDTIPQMGWLDALVAYAQGHPRAAVVGSKLLFANNTVQHAGVVIREGANPLHLYSGFPADHPAVNKSRRFQAVTAACALVDRQAFTDVGGFDTAFHNGFEDIDLCFRLGQRGFEIHYCHKSVVGHLESASRGKDSEEVLRNAHILRRRWSGSVRRDDVDYYLEDGLMQLRYADTYPIAMEVGPELAVIDSEGRRDEADRLLEANSRQILGLLTEVVRLTARIADLELEAAESASTSTPGAQPGEQPASGRLDHDQLLAQVQRIDGEIHALQAGLARALRERAAARGEGGGGRSEFGASDYLEYQKLVSDTRELIEQKLPPRATVAVATKGDDDLLDLGTRAALHFPQDDDGRYSGHYPADSAEAIAELELVKARGADYLVFPATAFWWLEHYGDFAEHLNSNYPPVTQDGEICLIFDLVRNRRSGAAAEMAGNEIPDPPMKGRARGLSRT